MYSMQYASNVQPEVVLQASASRQLYLVGQCTGRSYLYHPWAALEKRFSHRGRGGRGRNRSTLLWKTYFVSFEVYVNEINIIITLTPYLQPKRGSQCGLFKDSRQLAVQ